MSDTAVRKYISVFIAVASGTSTSFVGGILVSIIPGNDR